MLQYYNAIFRRLSLNSTEQNLYYTTQEIHR